VEVATDEGSDPEADARAEGERAKTIPRANVVGGTAGAEREILP